MADIVDQATRSRYMAGIRGKNTKPELRVRSFLHLAGLRFRIHQALPGKPDLVFPRHKTVIFVHGCFWHQHEGCRFAYVPETNRRFWRAKFTANKRRDRRNSAALRKGGWRVLTMWECQTRSPKRLQALAKRLLSKRRAS